LQWDAKARPLNHQVARLAVVPAHDAGRKACLDHAVAQHHEAARVTFDFLIVAAPCIRKGVGADKGGDVRDTSASLMLVLQIEDVRYTVK
jgi:hypothetical protein